MTDRVKGFTITLTHDVRIDDIEAIETALKMIKGVADVEPSISTHEDHMAQARVKWELRDKFFQFMKDNLG